MFTAAPAPAPEDALAADPSAERAGRHGRVLAELVEIGMDLARLVRRQALEQAGEAQAPEGGPRVIAADPGLAFSRIARAVRLSLVLEDRLAEARRVQVEKDEAQAAERRAAEAAAVATIERRRVEKAKNRVRDPIVAVAEAEAAEDEFEDLMFDLDERLDDAGEAIALEDRPIGEWVAAICRDLGLTPDWGLWADEDWAIEAAACSVAAPAATAPIEVASVGLWSMRGESGVDAGRGQAP